MDKLIFWWQKNWKEIQYEKAAHKFVTGHLINPRVTYMYVGFILSVHVVCAYVYRFRLIGLNLVLCACMYAYCVSSALESCMQNHAPRCTGLINSNITYIPLPRRFCTSQMIRACGPWGKNQKKFLNTLFALTALYTWRENRGK